jgi:tRNA U34 5-methylaminomethyl-2-thiouridine-forming methyltransferase MnmC
LWELPNFLKIAQAMKSQGVLITYCAKGVVKRTLKAAGFTIESLPGPVGKREITRAIKN